MLKREKLLDILKSRFDYYAAQAVYNELVSSAGLGDVDVLDAAALRGVTTYLAEKIPGTKALVERLNALAAEATEPKAAPVADAPAAEAAPEAAVADDGKKKKKK